MANKGPRAQTSITSFTEERKRKNEEALDRENRRKIEDETPQATEPVNEQPATDSTSKPQIKHKNVPMFKTLRKLGNKLEQVNHHYDLLMDFKSRHQTPRGLNVRANPSAANFPIDLYTKWEEPHITFSEDLTENVTDILIEHWPRKIEVLTQDHIAAHNTSELQYITSPRAQCKVLKKTHLTQTRERGKEDKMNPKKRKKKKNSHHRRYTEDNPGRYINNRTLITNSWTQRPLIAGQAQHFMKNYRLISQRDLPKTRLKMNTTRSTDKIEEDNEIK